MFLMAGRMKYNDNMDAKEARLNKDYLYDVLCEPTREKFRELLKNAEFENDYIDFKKTWIEKEKLAKLMLALANSKGGCVIIGVAQNPDNTFTPSGIIDYLDHAALHRDVKNYLPEEFEYELHNFSYDSSEYEKLNGKKFQLLVVKSDPVKLPFIAKKSGNDIKEGSIYIRKGTEVQNASYGDVAKMIKNNVVNQPNKGKKKDFAAHLEQLRTLYTELEHPLSSAAFPYLHFMLSNRSMTKAPECPEESYNEYIAKLIQRKKKIIEDEMK